jgi:hypothetical protein
VLFTPGILTTKGTKGKRKKTFVSLVPFVVKSFLPPAYPGWVFQGEKFIFSAAILGFLEQHFDVNGVMADTIRWLF